MINVIAIDPGDKQSAILYWDNTNYTISKKEILDNEKILDYLQIKSKSNTILVIEMIASYGMPVGVTVFETCLWVGRFIQAWGGEYKLVYRKDIKLHLCNSPRAKDTNVRQALIDKYGEPGTKKCPGFLYGIKKDLWSALAVATYYNERILL